MRTIEEEIELRIQQREKYFEDPHYQKWSSIARNFNGEYGGLSDDYLFKHYVMCSHLTPLTKEIIEVGMNQQTNQTINLESVYAYFDERLNDENNPFRDEISFFHLCTDESLGRITIQNILDKYRTMVLKPSYDIV